MKILRFYIDGFKNMKIGKTLWLLIAIKLLIMFCVVKILFFNETLNTKFQSPSQKADFVIKNLTRE